jgi:hypothetical protein
MMKLTLPEKLAVAMLILNAAAALGYLSQRRWSLALYWIGAAIICTSMIWQAVKR